jgi:hypothetical protein
MFSLGQVSARSRFLSLLEELGHLLLSVSGSIVENLETEPNNESEP